MHQPKTLSKALFLGASLLIVPGFVHAKPKQNTPLVVTTPAGEKIQAKYAEELSNLQKEIASAIPTISERKQKALQDAREILKIAEEKAATAQKGLGDLANAHGSIAHAKGKWIGGADKGIAKAQEDLKNSTTDAQREAAQKDLAHWQDNREQGIKALQERTANLERLQKMEPELKRANEVAQTELAKAKADEKSAANAILADTKPVLSSEKLDVKLVKCAVLQHATPGGLAKFAEQGPDKLALVEKLLSDTVLIKEMLAAGGASFGKYGSAMEIYTSILKASPKASSDKLRRLALATSLAHAQPIKQNNAVDAINAPDTVDPVKRYLHYEKAFLDGELDPAFANFSTWEYRHVVNCESPDEILAWGREMLRTYRPDHIYNPDYGWRYVSAVRTEVPYGSQNVKNDLPSLQQHQNIIMNGGICGRRAFFGRFMLRSFGIPTWGVTQKAHAALSHWTPKGWVVNLGAGFHASWWDKDEVSMSGTQFLQEAQARAHGDQYLKVLRAQWISRALGEEPFNERRKISGGFWSNIANYTSAQLASTSATLGPLGQELGEANESDDKKVSNTTVSTADQKVVVKPDGSISIPAVASAKPSGKFSAMKSFDEGMQLHALGGFKTQYEIDAPTAGKYELTANVATAQTGQIFIFSANSSSAIESAVPYTMGLWKTTAPIIVELTQGKNLIDFELKQGSRGVTIKDFALKAAN